MSNNVSWNLRVSINDGMLEEFRALADEMIAATATEDGALCYEWYVSEDGSTCHIIERYADSAAMMVHLGNFGANYADRFMPMVQVTSFDIYGPANDEVRNALAGFGTVHYDSIGGFNR